MMLSMNWIVPPSVLMNTPSRADMIKEPLERVYRARTTWFIEELGRELFKSEASSNPAASAKLSNHSRLIVSTAQVLFHRFYVYQSFKQHDRFIMATAALFLASKVEESFFFRVDRVVRVYLSIRKIFQDSTGKSIEQDPRDIEMKVLLAERILLQTLCFDLQITHPYKYLVDKVRALRLFVAEEQRSDFYQTALNFLNDSYRTTLCLQFHPHQIAVSTIYLAILQLGLEPQSKGPASSSTSLEKQWFDLLDASGSDLKETDIINICTQILALYHSDSSVWTTIDATNAAALQTRVNSIAPKSSQPGGEYINPSPNTVSNPLSGTHATVPADWQARLDEANADGMDGLPIVSVKVGGKSAKSASGRDFDDDHEEVNLDDPYPYDENVGVINDYSEGGNESFTKSVRVTTYSRHSGVLVPSTNSLGITASSSTPAASVQSESPYSQSSSSTPPPPPSDTPIYCMASDSQHEHGDSLDISGISQDDVNVSVSYGSTMSFGCAFQAPVSVASSSGASDSVSGGGFGRMRSLSAVSDDMPPPPPPTETPERRFDSSGGVRDSNEQSPKRPRLD